MRNIEPKSVTIFFLITEKIKHDRRLGYVVNPYHQVKVVGENATFKCYSTTRVKWYLNGKELPSNVILDKTGKYIYNVRISSVTMENSGVYECQGVDTGGPFISHGILEVFSKFFYNSKFIS